MNFKNNIKRFAEMRGFSITALEDKAGLGHGTIQKWDKDHKPNIGTLQKIAKALDVPLIDVIVLVEGDD